MSLRDLLRRHGALAAAIVLCALHFSSFDIARQPIVTDVRYFVYLSWRVAEGAVPHLDYFENKTALATFVGAGLHRIASVCGFDPLMTMRVGFLGIASLCGLLLFFVLRTLGRGRAVAGWLGVAAYCSFGLLGVLPSVGPIPKLLMAVCGTATALLLHARWWFCAGVCGALAFMDWQIGGLALLAAVATAALYGERRVRAVTRVVVGGVAGFAPFLVYYLAHGALSEAVRQVIGSSLFRGSEVVARVGFGERWVKIAETATLSCPSQVWLFYLGLAGMVGALGWMWRWRRDDRARLLLPLLIFHGGVVAFSLLDFQFYGDFFLLLHSAALFLGITWVVVHDAAVDLVAESRRVFVSAAILLFVLVLARPGPLRPRLELVTRLAAPGTTLADQREVADALSERIGDGTVAFVGNSEAFFLMGKKNELPVVYWNMAAYHYYRRPDEDLRYATGVRMLTSAGADAVVSMGGLGYSELLARGYELSLVRSDGNRYSVTVALRPPEGPG
jgi:hypothetical protein